MVFIVRVVWFYGLRGVDLGSFGIFFFEFVLGVFIYGFCYFYFLGVSGLKGR